MAEHIELGKRGEELASIFLTEKGYTILTTNFRHKKGEIDVIAQQNETIIFVEVKTRKSNHFGYPEESISEQKQMKLQETALAFLQQEELTDYPIRFDVIAITFSKNKPTIFHIEDAFFH